jgi:hypothetical protein
MSVDFFEVMPNSATQRAMGVNGEKTADRRCETQRAGKAIQE